MGKITLKAEKQTSIKQSFYRYIFIMAMIVILLSALTIKICANMRDRIIISHAYILEPNPDFTESDAVIGTYIIPPEEQKTNMPDSTLADSFHKFSDREKFLCHILEFFTIILPFLYVCLGIWISASIFYSRNLKEPFYLLEQGISHIQQGDLDFALNYPRQDELGQLCNAFEIMKQEILNNHSKLWNMVEERKRMNASVAHDLRTPITIIKGYTEYLKRNLSKETVSANHFMEILGFIENAAQRLESYADSVHHIHILENIELEYQHICLTDLSAEILSTLNLMAKDTRKQINVSANLPNQSVTLSSTTIFRILENLVINACYYSREKIMVTLGFDSEYFTITVMDDGDGFSQKDIQKAFYPFYKETGKENHYGMGLTICKILSQKHGGDIFLENNPNGGAKVLVQLKIDPLSYF